MVRKGSLRGLRKSLNLWGRSSCFQGVRRLQVCDQRVQGYDQGEERELQMLKPSQFAAFTLTRRDDIRRTYRFIPRNRHYVRGG